MMANSFYLRGLSNGLNDNYCGSVELPNRNFFGADGFYLGSTPQ